MRPHNKLVFNSVFQEWRIEARLANGDLWTSYGDGKGWTEDQALAFSLEYLTVPTVIKSSARIKKEWEMENGRPYPC